MIYDVEHLFKIIFFVYLFLALGLWCCTHFSLVVASGGYSLVVVRLIAVASLFAEHRF